MRVTASLLPEPECNAIQEFVSASELIELGYPVSSHIVVEPAGVLDSASASASVHGFPSNSHQNVTDCAKMEPLGGFFGDQVSTTDPRHPVVEKRGIQKHDLEKKSGELSENGTDLQDFFVLLLNYLY